MKYTNANKHSKEIDQPENQILLFVHKTYHENAKAIFGSLKSARFVYTVVSDGEQVPVLTHKRKKRFSVLIFETIQLYLDLDSLNKQMIDEYCKNYKVGVIFFIKPPDDSDIKLDIFPEFSLSVRYDISIKNYKLKEGSPVWRILRPGETIRDPPDPDSWAVFHGLHSAHVPLATAETLGDTGSVTDPVSPNVSAVGIGQQRQEQIQHNKNATRTIPVAVLDTGASDGVQRVFFGNNFQFWLHGPMLLDSISYLSLGNLSLPLDRLMQVDIDDIFVGESGSRMTAEDVMALRDSQATLRGLVDGFTFLLGFSGDFYQTGSETENLGDQTLLELKDEFRWFPHMWHHDLAHLYSRSKLLHRMNLNHKFAKDNQLPLSPGYAVSPHHSGVYPVYEPLYSTWREVWNITVTSTMNYPTTYPSWDRRGFSYRDVMVLPRQTCGLFTHTIWLQEYPGGPEKLQQMIEGGQLFNNFLYNPVNIFMTHMSNYCNDRLGLYTFERAVRFVQRWTNLRLRQVPPLDMAQQYFDMFPYEWLPVWTNPCSDQYHLEIWPANKTCDTLPRLLVVGPQHTGMTELNKLLLLHPLVRSHNQTSDDVYNELQFFLQPNYLKGIDWYMESFPQPANATSEILLESSADYFDSPNVPMRAYSLLPNSTIVCTLINPAFRAFTCYQERKAKQDPVAMKFSFYEVITATEVGPSELWVLRNRCLLPGLYEKHLNNWLQYYPSTQIYVMDGDRLKTEPAQAMEHLQQFLHIDPHYNYSSYCQAMSGNQSRCLGISSDPDKLFNNQMEERSLGLLQEIYRKPNNRLYKLLHKLNIDAPGWLIQDLTN